MRAMNEGAKPRVGKNARLLIAPIAPYKARVLRAKLGFAPGGQSGAFGSFVQARKS